MHFDDRLATVLRHRAAGTRAARTQFRQLLDLLGEQPRAGNPSLKAAAYLRLIALGEMIPVRDRAAIVGEAGWRFRNPELVRWFGEAHPAIAAAALARASLTGEEWAALIPRLPIRARGFLRHRRDLPLAAVSTLDRLGVSDRALPLPDILELAEEPAVDRPLAAEPGNAGAAPDEPAPLDLSIIADPAPATAPRPPASAEPHGIRELVQRIEAFKEARGQREPAGPTPRLPLAGEAAPRELRPLQSFLFGTDSSGRIDWAEPQIAPMVMGIDLAARRDPSGDEGRPDFARNFINRQPVRDALIELRGADRIAGTWVVDAAPRFTPGDGRFYGYAGKFRRAAEPGVGAGHREADRLRQLLHELRTPVNAIQGFAEVIQQQIFGPTPHEYRALAASIAGDSARMLAGFDELDRLARLESGALDLDVGTSDFAAIAERQVRQLQGVLNPRVARFDAAWNTDTAPVALAQQEAEMLAWRVLATLAAATGAGETVAIACDSDGETVELCAALPAALQAAQDIFSAETRPAGGAVSAGIFGAGFALRLARAEARAAGGELVRSDDRLVLGLPLLTGAEAVPSPQDAPGRAAG